MPTRENYKTLLNVARKDLDFAKHGGNAENVYTEGVCYHCHQCVEKVLKAFLDYNRVNYPFIHNIEKLNADCQEIDDTFSTLNIKCSTLNNYLSDFRYVDESEILMSEMYDAIDIASFILDFVNNKIDSEDS